MTTMPLPTSGPETPPPTGGRPSRLLIGLIATGGVLLLAVVAIVFLLIGRGSAEPAAGDTPSPSPTGSASPSATRGFALTSFLARLYLSVFRYVEPN